MSRPRHRPLPVLAWLLVHEPPPGAKGKVYELVDGGRRTGCTVSHCGHPTAIYSYTGQLPWKMGPFLAPNGRGFMKLQDAKNGVLMAYLHHERTTAGAQ